MSLADVLGRTIGHLDAAGVPYMVTGSRASTFHGEPAAKIDFIVRRDRPFSRAEFDRRGRVDLLGMAGYVATVEDMIIAKLEWAAASGSERQTRDVAGMLAVAGEALDRHYVERWIRELRLEDAWSRVAAS